MSEKILKSLSEKDRIAVEKFREYLRIPSVHPDIDYEPCVAFLKRYAKDLNLPLDVYYVHPRKPIAVFTWVGKEPCLQAILFNGHMDVVPVYEEKWNYKPFEAIVDDKGNIYGRGAQDMKSTSIQYLEAIRRLNGSFQPKRTVYVVFAPDEEVGVLGFREFVKTEQFRKMNIGFALDEGETSSTDEYIVYYGEKSCWDFNIHCTGTSGHGSLLYENTAGEKVRYLIDKFSDFRRSEMKKLEDDPSLKLWDITSVNLTQMSGGVQINVIPEEFCLTYDVRVAPTLKLDKFEETINRWCKEAGDGIWIEYEEKEQQRPLTQLDKNPYWEALVKVAKELGITFRTEIEVGATDSRFLREIGIPVLGISVLRNTPSLAHANNEFVNVHVFLEGVNFYVKAISALSDV